jgi:anti-sigma factor RsiW
MNELEFQEEWLSAYLDDELTDEQRRVVEQRLAVDPAAHATLEDLQRVRSMVANLPSWSGPALKFAMPSGTPGSFDEADSEDDGKVASESNDLDDFEEVPRIVAGGYEPSAVFRDQSKGNFNLRSLRTLLGWGAAAAGILLVVGLGYRSLYPPTDPTVAYQTTAPESAANAPSPSTKLAQDSARGMESRSFAYDSIESSGLGRDAAAGGIAGRASEFGAPARGGNQSPARLAEPTDSGPLAKESQQPQAAALALQTEQPPGDAAVLAAGSNLKSDLDSHVTSPPPSPSKPASAGMGGMGGAASEVDLAMNKLSADTRSRSIEAAEITDASNPSAHRAADKSAESQNAQAGTAFYFARSQSWSDVETLSRLSPVAQQNRADPLVFGNNALQNSAFQRGAGQDRTDDATERVWMAAIKPEVANSPEFFQNIVTSNRLVEVNQSFALNQLSAANAAQATNSVAIGRLEAAQSNAPTMESANALTLNRYSNQRGQVAVSNQPQGNSFVLFVTRDEANQILTQLQEKGQVTSQLWTINKLPESQVAVSQNARDVSTNNAATSRSLDAANQRDKPLNQETEAVSNDKVILMLNGPPN